MSETELKTAEGDVKTEASAIAADLKADVAKAKSYWQSHEVYIVGAIAFVVGAVITFFLK